MLVLRRRPVTLLELLVVMAILMLVSGIVAVSINKALVDQRFRSEVSFVVDELRLAQDLMLILGTDVKLIFIEDNQKTGINYWIELETKLPEGLQREVLRKHAKLKTIRGIFFEGYLGESPPAGRLELKFLSRGAVMTRGILKLSTSDKEDAAAANALFNYICLPGFPAPINSTGSLEVAQKACSAASSQQFDERLTQDTIQRLPEKIRQAEEVPKQETEKQPESKEKSQPPKKKT